MRKVLLTTLLIDYFTSIFILIYSILKNLPAHTYVKMTMLTLITLDLLIFFVYKIISIIREVQKEEEKAKEEQAKEENKEDENSSTINMDLTYDANDVKELLNDEQNQEGDAIDQDNLQTEETIQQ